MPVINEKELIRSVAAAAGISLSKKKVEEVEQVKEPFNTPKATPLPVPIPLFSDRKFNRGNTS